MHYELCITNDTNWLTIMYNQKRPPYYELTNAQPNYAL